MDNRWKSPPLMPAARVGVWGEAHERGRRRPPTSNSQGAQLERAGMDNRWKSPPLMPAARVDVWEERHVSMGAAGHPPATARVLNSMELAWTTAGSPPH